MFKILRIISISAMVAYPTTMFSSSPLTCDLCTVEANNCQFMKNREDFNYTIKQNNPGHFGEWVRKYCTMTEIDDFTLYFPYLLLFFPLMMIATEKGFDRYFIFQLSISIRAANVLMNYYTSILYVLKENHSF